METETIKTSEGDVEVRGFNVTEVNEISVARKKIQVETKDDEVALMEKTNSMSLTYLKKCVISPVTLDLNTLCYKDFKLIDEAVKRLSGLSKEESEN